MNAIRILPILNSLKTAGIYLIKYSDIVNGIKLFLSIVIYLDNIYIRKKWTIIFFKVPTS